MQQKEKIYIRNRYKIETILDSGGFGITYLAEDTEFCQKVVLKKYCPLEDRKISYEKGKKDFLREARTLSALSDITAIVRVLDYFEERGDAYIVMEYVKGHSLRKYIENRIESMNFSQAWDFFLPIIDALEKMHEKNLIHRDINPDNIIVREDETLKLIDFGSAREYASDVTMTAIVKGGYAPPEQYMRKGKQGPWTDVYSICATIYEMITGVIPESSIERQNKDKLYPPSSYGCEITPQQEESLMKGLSLDYKRRYQNIVQLKQSLSSKKEKETASGRKDKRNRNKLGRNLIVIVLMVGSIFISAMTVKKHKTDLYKAEQKEWQEKSLREYPRDSKQRLLLLDYLARYGQYKGQAGEEKIYFLPEWAAQKINVRCDFGFFPQKKEEYISYLRRKGISLKLEDKRYQGVIYIKPVTGTLRTYFSYTEIYDIGQNCGMNIVYDVTTHEVTRAVFYRKNKRQKLDYLISIASQSIIFFAKDWELPLKKTQQKVKVVCIPSSRQLKKYKIFVLPGWISGNIFMPPIVAFHEIPLVLRLQVLSVAGRLYSNLYIL
ncbi:MAG: serine/threonine protein kinase [Anaerobutyricum soehngenii]